eukprot:scaffold647_cov70-Phaeocystis_antarctica.AAC.6
MSSGCGRNEGVHTALGLRQGSELIFAVRASSCSEMASLGVSSHSVPSATRVNDSCSASRRVDPWLDKSPCLLRRKLPVAWALAQPGSSRRLNRALLQRRFAQARRHYALACYSQQAEFTSSSPAVRSDTYCCLASRPPPPARCYKGGLRTLHGRAPPTAAAPRRPRPGPHPHPCTRSKLAARHCMLPRAAQPSAQRAPMPADLK